MKNKKVSIIMPIWNCEKFLNRAVQSVLSQTYKNFELILVDDGSSDNSPKICDEYAKMDERVVVVHKQNGGPSSARNRGLELATGEFIEFVDSDDYLEKDCVESLVKGIQNCDLAICGFEEMNKDIEIISFNEDRIYNLRDDASLFFNFVKKKLISTIWNKLYRKDKILNNFDDSYFIGEDVIFNLKYLQNCDKVSAIAKILYHYDFTNQDSIMHTKVREREQFVSYWEEIYDFCSNYFKDRKYEYYLNGHYIRAVMLQIMNETIKKNLKYKEFKKLFKVYRSLPRADEAIVNCDKNILRRQRLFGRILIYVFKLKLKLPFYFALKVFKYKRYGRKKK